MEIKKVTEKFNLYQEGADYIVDLGNIKRAEERAVELVISGVEDSNILSVHPSCGCTISDRIVIDANSISVKLNYKDCDATFSKTVTIKYNNTKIGLIKLKGKCQ